MAESLSGRLLRGLSRRAGLRLFRLFSRPLQDPPAPSPTLILRRMDERDMLALCADPSLDLREEGVRAAFARGDVCVAALDDSALAGYCWFAFAPLHQLDGVWVAFGPQAAWTYKSLVRPAYRGRGVAPALYRYADAACREHGSRTSLISVESHNAPSIRAALRAGYADAGRAGYLCRGRHLLPWYSAAASRHGVRFFLP